MSLAHPILFAGPTLQRAGRMEALPLADYRIEPPVVRGTIAQLVRASAPGCAVIVDGLFHEALSIGHAELRDALHAGWEIWGLSSIGAIRARELRSLGIRGYGRVYARYCGPDDFRDDEVALLHGEEPSYRELSEPLVHIRAGLDDLVAASLLSSEQRERVLAPLVRSWFGERTLERTRAAIVTACPDAEGWVEAWLAGFDRYRVKALDLIQFMRERPWAAYREECQRDDSTSPAR